MAACGNTNGRDPGATVSVERGAELYGANCQTCHGGAAGAGMMAIPPAHDATGHTWHHPDCQLVETVLNGSGPMGPMMRAMTRAGDAPAMPAFREALTEADVADILAYIKTLWTQEQREHQARVTGEFC